MKHNPTMNRQVLLPQLLRLHVPDTPIVSAATVSSAGLRSELAYKPERASLVEHQCSPVGILRIALHFRLFTSPQTRKILDRILMILDLLSLA